MSISFLFLLLLFIDGFSLATPPACSYNTQTALNDEVYPCRPHGHCKEIKVSSEIGGYYGGLKFICEEKDYLPENLISWRGSTFPLYWRYNRSEYCDIDFIAMPQKKHIRCRKIRSCDLAEYFDENECDINLYDCMLPRNSDNEIKCDKGELEIYLFNEWIQPVSPLWSTSGLHCVENRIAYDIDSDPGVEIQLLRCKRTAVCKKENVESLTDTCSGECPPITVQEYAITCPQGYNLEGQIEFFGAWAYLGMENVSCSGADINSGSPERYDKYRCWKRRTCDIHSLFDANLCDPHLSCVNVVLQDGSLLDYRCPEGYQLEHTPLGSSTINSTINWWNAELTSNFCDEFMRLRLTNSGYWTIPEHIRCVKEKKCDIELFFDASKCDSDGFDCEMPTREPFSKSETNDKFMAPLKCQADFGLQARFNQFWVDLTSSVCNRDAMKFEVVPGDGSVLTEYPSAFRCVRKKIPDVSGCGSDEICEKPFNCTSLDCPPFHALQMKIDGIWTVVKSAKCKPHVYHVTLMDDTLKIDNSIAMKCVRKKHSQCSENPCLSCPYATFQPATKWDEISKFNCGPNSRPVRKIAGNKPTPFPSGTILECDRAENIDTVYWKGNNEGTVELIEAKSVDCEYLCTLHSPINSTCPENDTHCKPIIPNNTQSFHPCNVFYKSENSKSAIPIDFLECNMQNGSWIASRKDKFEEILPIGSNVYCYEGDCDETRFFPSCEDDEECKQHITKGHKFHCGESTGFWSREDYLSKWIKMENVTELECSAGEIVANGVRQSYDFQATCRSPLKAPQAKQGSVGLIVGMTFMILILIVIIIATVILRVTGNGWIHTIILDKIRGEKRQESCTVSATSIGNKSPSVGTPKQSTSGNTTKKVIRHASSVSRAK